MNFVKFKKFKKFSHFPTLPKLESYMLSLAKILIIEDKWLRSNDENHRDWYNHYEMLDYTRAKFWRTIDEWAWRVCARILEMKRNHDYRNLDRVAKGYKDFFYDGGWMGAGDDNSWRWPSGLTEVKNKTRYLNAYCWYLFDQSSVKYGFRFSSMLKNILYGARSYEELRYGLDWEKVAKWLQ